MIRLALIPARGLSDRIPYKNLVDLCGRPLIEWTIMAARASGVFDSIAVSTEDCRVAQVAVIAGADVINRPKEMAAPTSPTFDTVKHAFGVMPCDLLVLLQPTSPLRTVEDICGAVDVMDQSGADSVISITESVDWHGKLVMTRGHAGRIRPSSSLHENGAIYAITGEALRSGHDFYSGIMHEYWMPPERSIDIDTMADMDRAREMMQRRTAA